MTGSIGSPVARPDARRIAAGRGRFTDDHDRPGLLHAAFLRSPVARGRIVAVDIDAASKLAGIMRVLVAGDIDSVCRPMETRLEHVPAHRSPIQPPLARDHVLWQGEPIALVLANTRAAAEDALDAIALEIEPLPAVASIDAARHADAESANAVIEDNVALRFPLDAALPDRPSKADGPVVGQRFRFARVAGVSLEPRAILADYDPGDGGLSVVQSHQSPHLMQAILARHFDIPEHKVRVVAPDVGGAFGLKMHVYGDELAVVAASRLLGRPVKFAADRMEALLTDAQAREAEIETRLSLGAEGAPEHLQLEVTSAIGAYSIYPRSSIGDPIQALTMAAGPYRLGRLSGTAWALYQNKAPSGAIRGVGQPLACTVTEVTMDHAARTLGLDPADYRRGWYLTDADCPTTTLGGLQIDRLSLVECHDALLARMDYAALRREQKRLRKDNVYRGIGVAAFIEQTALGAGLYGPAGLPVSAQDSCIVRLEPSGGLRVEVGCTDQGQGTLTGISQIVAAAFGVPFGAVAVSAGDSAGAYGGGAWASRGLAISGEAAHQAALALRTEVLRLAGAILQSNSEDLSIVDGAVHDATGARLQVEEVARIGHFQQDLLPPSIQPQLTAVRAYIPRAFPYAVANGIQGCHLEVEVETGAVRLLGHWVAEDCGRVVNPMLVDEQIRGGVVNGLGNALYEACIYDEDGQMRNATLADYLVPMASEMPDIDVVHVETPMSGSELGIKGAGEAGTVAAAAAVWCALNDALTPFDAVVTEQPFTPEVVLHALGKVG